MFALLQNFFTTEFLWRRLATKFNEGQKELFQIAEQLEVKSKSEAYLASTASRCKESAEHLLQFVLKTNSFLESLLQEGGGEGEEVKSRLNALLKE